MTNTTAAPTGDYHEMNRLMSLMTGDEKHGPAATSSPTRARQGWNSCTPW
ncbi:hypothetical protein [Streptomyces sp. NBC_00057]